MTLPANVTQAQWESALVNCELWKPGQRCNGECRRVTARATGFYEDERGDVQLDTEYYHEPHEKTCPEPSDALLMQLTRMVIKTQGIYWFAERINAFALPADFDAAIILAAAALA